ncbi:MAG: cupin domain-containing protein [Tepidiformaceae bacterium]
MDERWAVSLDEAEAGLPAEGTRFARAIRHGSLLVGLYAPRGSDPQEPHQQDEVYLVQRGQGTFVRGAERVPFQAGAALFVRAGEAHCFEDFSDDLAVWVVFYGPTGGEAAAQH